MMNYETLKVDYKDALCFVTFDRPHRMNAYNFELMDDLEAVLDEVYARVELNALIFTGYPHPFFSSGGDLKDFSSLKKADEGQSMARRMIEILHRIETMPIWTIAAINGVAYGGAVEFTLACDIRLMASRASLHCTQGKWALIPAFGGVRRLVEIVGKSRATEWLITQRAISAQEALGCGFCSSVLPDENFWKELLHFCHSIPRSPRSLVRGLKQTLKSATRHSAAPYFENEQKIFGALWENQEHQHRVEAFINRNKQG